MARSPRLRIFGVISVVSPTPAAQALAPGRDADSRTCALIRLDAPIEVKSSAQHLMASAARAAGMPWVRPRSDRARPRVARPKPRSDGRRDRRGLARSSRGASSSGVVRPVGGDAVDRRHGAVEDHVRLLFRTVSMACSSVGASAARRSTALAYAAVGRGDPCGSPRRDGRKCRRSAGGPGRAEPASRRSPPPESRSGGGGLREDRRGSAGVGWTDRWRTGGQARELLADCDLGVNPSTRSFFHVRGRGRPPTTRQVENGSLAKTSNNRVVPPRAP